ncbi:hypothetical protein MTO96_029395 [Rhipicephalus appendiculatus]
MAAGTRTATDIKTGQETRTTSIDKCWSVAVLAFVMTALYTSPEPLLRLLLGRNNGAGERRTWPRFLACMGLGMVATMLQVLISMYFERYRGAANGIMFAGSTASAIIIPNLVLYFSDTYGFRGSLLLLGAVLMNMIAVSLAFREPHWIVSDRKKRKGEEEAQRLSLSTAKLKQRTKLPATKSVLGKLRTVLKSAMMYILVITWLDFSYNFDIFLNTIVDFAMDKGLSLDAGVSFLTYTSIADLLGRLFLPWMTDSGLLPRSTLMTVNYFLMGLCSVSLPFCESYWTLLTACLGFSLFLGCGITMQSVMMTHYLGLDNLTVGYTILGALSGPVFLGKASFIGFFRDELGSYNMMFMVLSICSFFVGVLWVSVCLIERKRSRKWQPDVENVTSRL